MRLIIPQFWKRRNFISLLLVPFSLVYRFVIFLRQKANQEYISTAKIITVGNITIGGAGKTPTCISLAQMINNHTTKKVAFLTRGYKGKEKGPYMVDESDNCLKVGDEAILLSKFAQTCVAKDRLKGIKFLESQGFEVIITDDGFQDFRFKKDFSIIVVDGVFGFGNKRLFPAGPLREDIKNGLVRADIILIIGGKRDIIKSDKIILASLQSNALFENERLIAFAGIGNPEKFFITLEQTGAQIIKKISFPDHHFFSNKEIKDLLLLASKNNSKLITTEKDYTRISKELNSEILTLPVTLMLEEENKILDKILSL